MVLAMSRRRPLSEEERALWSGFARSITPLRPVRQRAASPPRPSSPEAPEERVAKAPPNPAAARQSAADAKQPPPLAPLDRRLRQRVARGTESIDGRIDLHGKTQKEAHAALLRFLRIAQADDAKMVLVVTGKGRAANAGASAGHPVAPRGVLKRLVPMWLALPEFRPLVVGFADAHIGHGGEGALYVRLRRRR
jgi:DNA-nicking Smr family endonuclease